VSDTLDDLLDLLDLEQIEVNLFRGRSPDETRQRVFGGQVAAQALVAAGRTMSSEGTASEGTASEDRPVHSLHAYFIHPGDTTVPLIYSVERVRDGRSFTTRRVSAIQHGRTIFVMSASFQRFEKGVSHASAMPPVPPPEEVRPSTERLAELLGEPLPAEIRDYPIELRHVGPLSIEVQRDPALRTSSNYVWLRTKRPLPDDPLLHVCLMTYASDLTLLDTVLRRHGRIWEDGRTTGASLDHAMWFHRPFRADQWLLFAQETPSAGGGRGLAMGHVFTEEGELVVSAVQEGLIRTSD
jgi:acyl-CoA thioesterase II